MTHARRAGDISPCAASCIPPELSDLDETSVALFRAFGRALRLHRQFMVRRLGASDVHPGQAACLSVLAGHDGIAQRDLAAATLRRLGVRRATDLDGGYLALRDAGLVPPA